VDDGGKTEWLDREEDALIGIDFLFGGVWWKTTKWNSELKTNKKYNITYNER